MSSGCATNAPSVREGKRWESPCFHFTGSTDISRKSGGLKSALSVLWLREVCCWRLLEADFGRITHKKNLGYYWFQLLICEYFLVCLLLCKSWFNIFGLWEKHDTWGGHLGHLGNIDWHFAPFSNLTNWEKPNCILWFLTWVTCKN